MRTYLFLACLVAGSLWPVMASAQPVAQGHATHYGAGVRFRGLFVPQAAFERFVDVAPAGISKPQIGIEIIQRRGTFDASLGVSWADISTEDGIWVDTFSDPDDNPSLIEFDGFSWIAVDVNAIWKRPLSPNTALRYGLGIGLGIVMGDILETDYVCPGTRYDLTACSQAADATAVRKPLDVPPVLPLVNAILGFQYAPSNQVAINIDGGVQTTLFVGISVDYFFLRK